MYSILQGYNWQLICKYKSCNHDLFLEIIQFFHGRLTIFSQGKSLINHSAEWVMSYINYIYLNRTNASFTCHYTLFDCKGSLYPLIDHTLYTSLGTNCYSVSKVKNILTHSTLNLMCASSQCQNKCFEKLKLFNLNSWKEVSSSLYANSTLLFGQ